MTDENGNTVDSFPPFSTLEEDEAAADGYEIHDDGADSPRVIGKVVGGTENALDGAQTRQRVQTPPRALQAKQRTIPFVPEQVHHQQSE